MLLLFIAGILLTLSFGFGIGAYCVYKMDLRNFIAKAFSFVAIGTVASIITFALAVMAVWPPYF